MREQRETFRPELEPWLQLRLRVLLAVASLAIGGLVVAGCGPKSDRLEISGEVTLDGASLDGGTIRFSSTGSGKLIATGAMIQGGRFQISREKGLRPGIYTVEISSPDANAPPGALTAPERIPSEYNVNSQKTVEVAADGENHFVFDIVAKTR